jgi:hypothetical protein
MSIGGAAPAIGSGAGAGAAAIGSACEILVIEVFII